MRSICPATAKLLTGPLNGIYDPNGMGAMYFAVHARRVAGVPESQVVPLGQGLSLMPMTDEVFDAVTDGSGGGGLGFWRLPGGFGTLLARWSAAGPIAYVEAEYFGGVGEQRAAVWVGGALALGPLDEPTKKRFS